MEKQPYFNIGDIPETSALKERIMLPFRQLNWLLNGLVMDRITLITSSTDSGKTTVCSQFILNAIKQGYKTFYFAGEDSEDEARDRIYKQYTSFSEDNFKFVQYIQNGKATNCGEYILSHEKFEEAKNFFDNKLFIHNNSVPANKEGLINTIEQARIKEGCRFFVLDNVEIFDYAIGNIDGEMMLNEFAGNRTMHSLTTDYKQGGKMVKTVSMDTFFKDNNIDEVDFVKLDVEGGEQFILTSPGFLAVASKIKSMAIEFHYPGWEELVKHLESLGFKSQRQTSSAIMVLFTR